MTRRTIEPNLFIDKLSVLFYVPWEYFKLLIVKIIHNLYDIKEIYILHLDTKNYHLHLKLLNELIYHLFNQAFHDLDAIKKVPYGFLIFKILFVKLRFILKEL